MGTLERIFRLGIATLAVTHCLTGSIADPARERKQQTSRTALGASERIPPTVCSDGFAPIPITTKRGTRFDAYCPQWTLLYENIPTYAGMMGNTPITATLTISDELPRVTVAWDVNSQDVYTQEDFVMLTFLQQHRNGILYSCGPLLIAQTGNGSDAWFSVDGSFLSHCAPRLSPQYVVHA